MAESLSNVLDKNLFRHYFNFERGNLNPEYHRILTAGRQWKKAAALLLELTISIPHRKCPLNSQLCRKRLPQNGKTLKQTLKRA